MNNDELQMTSAEALRAFPAVAAEPQRRSGRAKTGPVRFAPTPTPINKRKERAKVAAAALRNAMLTVRRTAGEAGSSALTRARSASARLSSPTPLIFQQPGASVSKRKIKPQKNRKPATHLKSPKFEATRGRTARVHNAPSVQNTIFENPTSTMTACTDDENTVSRNNAERMMKDHMVKKLKSMIRSMNVEDRIIENVLDDMLLDYTGSVNTTRDMNGVHINIEMKDIADIADFFLMQNLDMLHDFSDSLGDILQSHRDFLGITVYNELKFMNPDVPGPVIRGLVDAIYASSGGILKRKVFEIFERQGNPSGFAYMKTQSGWESKLYEEYTKKSEEEYNRIFPRRMRNKFIGKEYRIRGDASTPMILDMSYTNQLRDIYARYRPMLHISSIVDAGQFFLPENDFVKTFRKRVERKLQESVRNANAVKKLEITDDIVGQYLSFFFPEMSFPNRTTRHGVRGTIANILLDMTGSFPNSRQLFEEQLSNDAHSFFILFKEKCEREIPTGQTPSSRNEAMIRIAKESANEWAHGHYLKNYGYAMDLQPFSYTIKTTFENKEIVLNFVKINPFDKNSKCKDTNNKNIQYLDILQINTFTCGHIRSKPAARRPIGNTNLNKTSRTRGISRLYTKLMQKHLGDFIPVMYSQALDMYYGTGDKMAAISYLLMHDIMRKNDAKIIVRRGVNRATPRAHAWKRKMFVEESTGVQFLGSGIDDSVMYRPITNRR